MGFLKQVAGNFIPSRKDISQSLGNMVRQAEQAVLSEVAPDNYEAYYLILQLQDTAAQLIQSFTFPVMPESMTLAFRYLMTVTPTLGGNFVDDFGRAPSPINLQGTFGKKPKAVLNGAPINLGNIGASLLDAQVATGYGMAKRLSAFIDASHTPIAGGSGRMPKVILYNYAFNSHWEVAINSFDVQMSVQQNGIWIYQMQLTALKQIEAGMNWKDKLIGQVVAGNLLNIQAVNSALTLVKGVQAVKGVLDKAGVLSRAPKLFG